ncbi:hypothetical protein ABTY96_37625 [Streptomyces sp. NPDC096057]|uniref:hypothetical protein n=1 Tax=Streptomyces sp. NPDC096057 TaxID=3155543 RepID=UPI0033261AB3
MDRSAVTRAVGDVSRLLAGRGFAVAERPGVRMRTMEDVFAFAYAETEGVQLRLDTTELQVRGQPQARAAAGPLYQARRSRTR